MKKPLTIIVLLFAALISAAGQINMTVASKLELIPDDVDAKSYYKQTDINDNVCAIIKVAPSHSLSGQLVLVTKGGMAPVPPPKNESNYRTESGEWWFWVSPKVTNIMFTCDGYTPTDWIGVSLKPGASYRLNLGVESKVTIVKEFAGSGLVPVNMTVFPSQAVVTYGDNEYEIIDSKQISDGYFDAFLAEGDYYFKVESKFYQTYATTIRVKKGMKELKVNLLPAFNTLNVLSEPSGALVTMDGESLGYTPISISSKVSPGSHSLLYKKKDYYVANQTIEANGDGTLIAVPTMKLKPQFGTVTLLCDDKEAQLVVSDPSGKTVFTGKSGSQVQLNSKLVYRLESSRTSYISQSVGITGSEIEGREVSVKVGAPVPIYGELQLASTPSRADVYLDGEYAGKTLFGDRLIIGKHLVELRKDGYITQRFTVDIKQDETVSLTKELKSSAPKTTNKTTSQESTNYTLYQYTPLPSATKGNNNTTKVAEPKKEFDPEGGGYMGGFHFGYDPYFKICSFGGMLGYTADFEIGAYVKFRSNFKRASSFYDTKSGVVYDTTDPDNKYKVMFFEPDQSIQTRWAFTLGGTFPVFPFTYIYAGVGFGAMKNYWQSTTGDYVYIKDLSRGGFTVEIGGIICVNPVYLMFGVTNTMGYADFELGFGFVFL